MPKRHRATKEEREKLDANAKKRIICHKADKIDAEQVRALAAILCTREEIAAVVKCHPDTLDNHFSEILKEGREVGKQSLRRLQYKAAMKGNVTMLIWLGKVYLGQRETKEVIVTDTNDDLFDTNRNPVNK